MVRLLGVCVALLGIVSLVFGIIFVVGASSAKAEVLDTLKDEGFPMFGASPLYPYLGLTTDALTNGDIIDTVDDLDTAADALDAARHAMVTPPAGVAGFGILYQPSTIQTALADGTVVTLPTMTLELHEYSALLGFSGVLGMSQVGLGMASLMLFVGIVGICVGVALMVTGLVVVKVARE